MKTFYTYILLCSDGKFYTGMTSNLPRRLAEHRAGKSISTRRRLPIQLIWSSPYFTRSEARKMEIAIKILGARRFLLRHFLTVGNAGLIAKYNLT
jgi:predicted GIY-YIG superfamily endonuclease